MSDSADIQQISEQSLGKITQVQDVSISDQSKKINKQQGKNVKMTYKQKLKQRGKQLAQLMKERKGIVTQVIEVNKSDDEEQKREYEIRMRTFPKTPIP